MYTVFFKIVPQKPKRKLIHHVTIVEAATQREAAMEAVRTVKALYPAHKISGHPRLKQND